MKGEIKPAEQTQILRPRRIVPIQKNRSLRPAHPADHPAVEYWSDPSGAGNPEMAVDAEENHYRHSEVSPEAISSKSTHTGFVADHPTLSKSQKEKFHRLWRQHHDLDVDPNEPKCGLDARQYGDKHTRVGENDEPKTREFYRWSDAICQAMDLPDRVREGVLRSIMQEDLRDFNNFGGYKGAAIGYSIVEVSNLLELEDIASLKSTEYWADIEQMADSLGIRGATGRQFRQLLNHVENNYLGGDHDGVK